MIRKLRSWLADNEQNIVALVVAIVSWIAFT
jgi:hypothetical protein